MVPHFQFLFFFSSRRRHTRWPRDWSSDVCSSDLFFPHHIEGTLIYLFAENNAYMKALDESPEFSDYSYDSRSGVPEGVSKEEFKLRRVAWNCVLDRDGVLKRTLEYKSMDAFDVMRKFTELSFMGDRTSPLWNRLLGAQDEPEEGQEQITLDDLLDRPQAYAQ